MHSSAASPPTLTTAGPASPDAYATPPSPRRASAAFAPRASRPRRSAARSTSGSATGRSGRCRCGSGARNEGALHRRRARGGGRGPRRSRALSRGRVGRDAGGAGAPADPRPGARRRRLVRRVARRRGPPGGDRAGRRRRAGQRNPHPPRRGDADGDAGWGSHRMGARHRASDRKRNRGETRMTDIRYLGHATCELSDGSATLLVDPFLKPNNPAAPISAMDVEPSHILITHGHADHIADAVSIAQRTGAHCVAIVEIASWLNGQGLDAVTDPNLGGTVEFDW